jgi:hypothetical protein
MVVMDTTGNAPELTFGGRYVDVLDIDETTGTAYYYSSFFRIWSVALNGCCAESQVATLGPPQWSGYRNHEIAFDFTGQQIYWAGEDENVPGIGEIRRTSFGSTIDQVLIGGLAEIPSHLLLDQPQQKIYWYEQNFIRRANSNGSGLEVVAAGVPSVPIKVDIDQQNEKLFWLVVEPNDSRSIYRSNLDGSNMNLVIQETNIASFAIDKRTVHCERTSLYSDITGIPNNVEFHDIAAVVEAFRGQSSISATLCDLYPCDAFAQKCVGDGIIDFRDISQAVDAFRGFGCR